MDETGINNVVNVLGGIADHLVFQMAFQYHLKNNCEYTEALKYTLDRLAETQDYIPEWVEGRNAERATV